MYIYHIDVMTEKVTREFTVENENGLHARPSCSLVKKANEYQSHIEVCNEDGDIVNGKSVIGIMCLGVGKGSTIKITAEGTDAHEAIYALGELFKDKFGETN